MISILNKNTSHCANLHYEACSPVIKKKLKLISDLFQVWSGKKISKKTSLQKDYDLHIDTIKTLIDPLLKRGKKKRGKKYNVNQNELASLFFSGNKHILTKDIPTVQRILYADFFENLIKDLDKILIGNPFTLNTDIICKKIYDLQRDDIIRKILVNIFCYEDFTKEGWIIPKNGTVWNSYKLTDSLGVSVCPYCNKNWVNTVFDNNGKKITNPQLDHFFCKSEYPLLRLSFYNLIPSCETCNARIKKNEIFDYDKFLHPYEMGFTPVSYFKAIPRDTASSQGKGCNYLISLEHHEPVSDLVHKNKNIKNYAFFRLKEVYEMHGDIVSEIYYIKNKYGMRCISSLLRTKRYKEMELSEIYRLIFSNYYAEEDHGKRPFAKLTRDIVEHETLI